MNQIKNSQSHIEQKTDKQLANLSDADTNDSRIYSEDGDKIGDHKSIRIEQTEDYFDMVYVASKPYKRTKIVRASTFEDGVNVVVKKFASHTGIKQTDATKDFVDAILSEDF